MISFNTFADSVSRSAAVSAISVKDPAVSNSARAPKCFNS
jgi:hypothetical protein